MTTFFFHYREPGLSRDDPEGEEHPNLDAALKCAILSAREIIAARIREEGTWIEGSLFEIADEAGKVLKVLSFDDAIVKVGRA